MIRTADGRLAVESAQAAVAEAHARTRVLLAGELIAAGSSRPSLFERLAARLRRRGDAVITTSSRPGRLWRVADMLVTAWGARSHVDVSVVEVKGSTGLRRAEFLTRMLSGANVPVVHLLRGADLADVAVEEPARLRRLLGLGQASVALSGHLYDALSYVGGVSDVIADPVEVGAYAFSARRPAAPRILWLLGAGPMTEPADVAAVLTALRGSHPDVSVTLVTSWSAPQVGYAVRDAAERSGVLSNLRVVDLLRAADVGPLLRDHDVLVNAVDVDDSPVGLSEAMASGMCVVCVDWGGASYLIADGVDGLLVKPRDPDGLAAAVGRLLSDPDLSERLSRAAHARAETFDWSRALPRWRSVLTRVAAKGEK